VHRMEAGTNVFQLEFPSPPTRRFQKRPRGSRHHDRQTAGYGAMVIQVNETILRRSPEEIGRGNGQGGEDLNSVLSGGHFWR